jgi:Uma2 family endonuclease
MAAASTPLTIEEYLATSYEPECEYVDGKLIPKPMGTREHGHLQLRLGRLLYRFEASGHCQVISEQSVRVREQVVLIPDVCLLPADNVEEGVVTTPALVCIEILSPSDRFSYTLKKCDEYLRWGVLACWILEPKEKKAWLYDSTGLHLIPRDGFLRTGIFELALQELWPA